MIAVAIYTTSSIAAAMLSNRLDSNQQCWSLFLSLLRAGKGFKQFRPVDVKEQWPKSRVFLTLSIIFLLMSLMGNVRTNDLSFAFDVVLPGGRETVHGDIDVGVIRVSAQHTQQWDYLQ
jgi:hypothetical protein